MLETKKCKKQNKSFKHMLNKIGPKTDPPGTPFKRADQELKDLSFLFFASDQTCNYLSVSKHLLRIHKHIWMYFENP